MAENSLTVVGERRIPLERCLGRIVTEDPVSRIKLMFAAFNRATTVSSGGVVTATATRRFGLNPCFHVQETMDETTAPWNILAS